MTNARRSLALVAIVPLVVLTLTSFVKISVVLSLVRNAIGAPDAPSGLVVTGLSLVLTFFVMAPVAIDMVHAAAARAAPNARARAGTAQRAPTAGWRALVPAEYQPQVDAAERGSGRCARSWRSTRPRTIARRSRARREARARGHTATSCGCSRRRS